MSGHVINEIIEHKKSLLAAKKDYYESLKHIPMTAGHGVFKGAICIPNKISLIAEVKKASPSAGIIRNTFDPVTIAQIYRDNGAAAVSVLTEEKYFLGEPEHIKQVSGSIDIPVLTKDFIFDEAQIYEAKYNGSDAVLLIVAILEQASLKHLLSVSRTIGIDCLVEVHDEEELKRALEAGAEIIGINNRNLKTLDVDTKTAVDLIPKVPKGKVVVAESGYTKHEEIQTLKELGAHAVLIGETFMLEQDIAAKVKEVMYGKS